VAVNVTLSWATADAVPPLVLCAKDGPEQTPPSTCWVPTTCTVINENASSCSAMEARGTYEFEIDFSLSDGEPVVDGSAMGGGPFSRNEALSLVIGLAMLGYFIHVIRSRKVQWLRSTNALVEPLMSSPPQQGRMDALDVFRGVTLALMVFVNYGGGGFRLFKHSAWDGLTIADVLFPWFAWIMGFSAVLAFRSRTRATPLSTAALRSAKLFALGLFLNNGESWSSWRFPGVLQALGAAYFVVCLALFCRRCAASTQQRQRCHTLPICSSMLTCVIIATTIYLVIVFQLHVPGCPRGYMGPGGSSDGGKYANCTGGAHLYVDLLVFGRAHIYQTPTCQEQYDTGPYDPEGLLNWLMVAVTALIGGACADHCQPNKSSKEPARKLLISGTLLLLLSIAAGGWLFTAHPWIPINKNLWSPSYVLLCSGSAAIALAALISICRKRPRWTGAPFVSMGTNSIFVYVMHELLVDHVPFSPRGWDDSQHLGHVVLTLFNATGVICWIAIALWMDERRVFITL
ncbi:TPA: hypothetical protein N0F65_008722, partial [Lagenidium giganteum]